MPADGSTGCNRSSRDDHTVQTSHAQDPRDYPAPAGQHTSLAGAHPAHHVQRARCYAIVSIYSYTPFRSASLRNIMHVLHTIRHRANMPSCAATSQYAARRAPWRKGRGSPRLEYTAHVCDGRFEWWHLLLIAGRPVPYDPESLDSKLTVSAAAESCREAKDTTCI